MLSWFTFHMSSMSCWFMFYFFEFNIELFQSFFCSHTMLVHWKSFFSSIYHPILEVHAHHSDPKDTWLLCDCKENAQRTCSIAFLSLSNHAVPLWTTNISGKLIFLIFQILWFSDTQRQNCWQNTGECLFFLSQWIPNFWHQLSHLTEVPPLPLLQCWYMQGISVKQVWKFGESTLN